MALVFSSHAVEQMTKRQISSKQVEVLVHQPDGSFPQSRDKQVLYKRFPKRSDNIIAVVIVSQKLGVSEVITVMHNFEVKK